MSPTGIAGSSQHQPAEREDRGADERAGGDGGDRGDRGRARRPGAPGRRGSRPRRGRAPSGRRRGRPAARGRAAGRRRSRATAANCGPADQRGGDHDEQARLGTTPSTAKWREDRDLEHHARAARPAASDEAAHGSGSSAWPPWSVGLDHGAVARGAATARRRRPGRGRRSRRTGRSPPAATARARLAVDRRSTRPIGTPATYGAPSLAAPGDHDVALGRRVAASSTRSRSRRPWSPSDAAAAQEADLHARAEPAADDRVGVDDQQHGRGRAGDPEHPADQAVVVEHGHVRAHARRRSRRRW